MCPAHITRSHQRDRSGLSPPHHRRLSGWPSEDERKRDDRPVRLAQQLELVAPFVGAQVFLCLHAHRRRLGLPRPEPEDLQALEDRGMARAQVAVFLPQIAHAC